MLIDIYAGVPDEYLTVVTAPSYVIVKPGEIAQVFLNVTGSRSAPTADHSFIVSLNITRMDDPTSEIIVVKNASLHISSLYGGESQYNRILGMFTSPASGAFQ